MRSTVTLSRVPGERPRVASETGPTGPVGVKEKEDMRLDRIIIWSRYEVRSNLNLDILFNLFHWVEKLWVTGVEISHPTSWQVPNRPCVLNITILTLPGVVSPYTPSRICSSLWLWNNTPTRVYNKRLIVCPSFTSCYHQGWEEGVKPLKTLFPNTLWRSMAKSTTPDTRSLQILCLEPKFHRGQVDPYIVVMCTLTIK